MEKQKQNQNQKDNVIIIEGSPSQQLLNMSLSQRQIYLQNIKQKQEEVEIVINRRYKQQDFLDDFVAVNSLQSNSQNNQKIKLKTYRQRSYLQQEKAIIVFFNHFLTYSDLTAFLAKVFAQNGYTIVSFDYPGHGRSQGQRGQILSKDIWIETGLQFLRRIVKLYPQKYIFIGGYGLGALLSLRIYLYNFQQFQKKVKGIFLGQTFFKIPDKGHLFKIASQIAMHIFSIMPTKIGIWKPDFYKLSYYKCISKFMQENPLNIHNQISANTLLQFQALTNSVPQELWSKIQTPPIVIIHGQKDRTGNAFNSWQFFHQIKSKDKEMWYFRDNMYSLIQEAMFTKVPWKLVAWCDKKLNKKSK